ncbi:CDP-alcohol phosphatidyltransferase family protein [Rudaeicoccus suwonensis]|uniref:CDP-alcohol phosphatidyltransferase-like enzyme n=1 Tax=Rudaeicoccus suwonensis TaxID=657409 RepID=A0A561E877_9MICO|nr:CDP-alcohol phosphatidyltransferase family protein [Rudaeicoccus suwonensis]TWE11823.1 CDP-alcohol phosphatidyltransferase-like enzyme [Rudaeicoccus suwonensis]
MTDTETFIATLQRLRGSQKTAKGAPAYSRFVNRKAGRVLAALSYRAGLTPNQVTGISGVFSLAAIVLIATVHPGVLLGIGVALLLAIGYAFDSADGQLARLRGGGSPVGEWLDHVVDCAKICALHLAVLISFYRFGWPGDDRILLIPLIWTFVGSVSFFVIILNDQIRRSHGTTAEMTTSASVVRSLLVAPTDYGVLLLIFVLYGAGTVFEVIYGLLLLANAAYLVLALHRWFREFSALPAKPAKGH